jgi:hypothetical protein
MLLPPDSIDGNLHKPDEEDNLKYRVNLIMAGWKGKGRTVVWFMLWVY